MARISVARVLVAALVVLASGKAAWADFVTYTGSSTDGTGYVRAASVTFSTSGANLFVTLTNTSTLDVVHPDQVLSGVFFSAPGALTAVDAIVPSGSAVFNDPANSGVTDVSSEWAYRGNIAGLGFGSGINSGISSSGLGGAGEFGVPDRFDTAGNLNGPDSPNGIGYGITSAGDDVATGNGGLSGRPLIQNSVVFTLSGWNAAWTLSGIGNVFFQYGTDLSEPRFPGTETPEPGTLLLLGLGVAGLIGWHRRKAARA
jgi:hypothetical protein